jgi:poly(ribitol-phosphate) beta-N-acetylglucosaminyltransferase
VPVPDVTVIIPAYNSIAYVAKAVESVLGQTLGMDRIELIAVDDGSTDGTGEELERLAARQPNMTVLHEENSGGPGRPRNAGLNLATGRFVFFLDADDYLNSESLERMLRAAEEQGSDVVLGKAEGTGGRRPPRSMFTTTQLSTDVFQSRAWWTLSALKLFRRDLIERVGLRFPTDLFYEDQPFCGVAYLEARAITILADYNYAVYAWREDGGNATLSQPPLSRLCEVIEIMIPLIAERVEPGPNRDRLLMRHFDREFFELFEHMARSDDADAVDEAFRVLREWAISYYPFEAIRDLSPAHRISHNLLLRGELKTLLDFMRRDATPGSRWNVIVEGDRAFAGYPMFRDGTTTIPDECFDVTERLKPRYDLADISWRRGRLHIEGRAYIDLLDSAETATELVLRERETGAEWIAPVERHASPGFEPEVWGRPFPQGRAGITAEIDPLTAAYGSRLPTGAWDVYVRLAASGFVREVRIGRLRDPRIDSKLRWRLLPEDSPGAMLVGSYFTSGFDNLTLDVGASQRPVNRWVAVTSASWSRAERHAIELIGESEVVGLGANTLSVALRGPGGDEHEVPVEWDGQTVSMRLQLRDGAGRKLPTEGAWTIRMHALTGEQGVDTEPTITRRLGLLWYWRKGLPRQVAVSLPREPFAITVTRAEITDALMEVLRGIKRRLQR